MSINRNLRAEWLKIQELPNSPETKEKVLVEITAAGLGVYEWLTPRDRAVKEFRRSLPVPFLAEHLLSTGALPGSQGQRNMDGLREQLHRAGVSADTPDDELREITAIARQRLLLSPSEIETFSTSDFESHLRHHLTRMGVPEIGPAQYAELPTESPTSQGPSAEKGGKVKSGRPGGSSSESRYFDERHRHYVLLFTKLRKATSIDKFLAAHKSFGKTSFTDYIAGRIKGRVSAEKRKEIEAAISGLDS